LRCYFCKTHLYNELKQIKNTYPRFLIVNGTNRDDFSDYRPGHKAAEEQNILSPLNDCGMSKRDIRDMARYFNLEMWNKPASPCLSSRIPYGEPITTGKLKQVEEAEEILYKYGYNDLRVRRRTGNICSIEVPQHEIERLKVQSKEIFPRLKEQAEFSVCIIDEEGLVSGKLNRVLTN